MINLTHILRLTNQAIEKALTSAYSPQKNILPRSNSTYPIYAPVMLQTKPKAYARIAHKRNPA